MRNFLNSPLVRGVAIYLLSLFLAGCSLLDSNTSNAQPPLQTYQNAITITPRSLPSPLPSATLTATSTPAPETPTLESSTLAAITTPPTAPIRLRPCVSYYDGENSSLKIACRQADATWRTQLLDNEGNVGLYSSLGFDKKRWAHISYQDQGEETLKYIVGERREAGFSWQPPEIVDQGGGGFYSSLTLDNEDNPYIAYYDRRKAEVKLAHRTSEGWEIQTVAFVGQPIEERDFFYSLATVMYNDAPLLVYLDYLSNQLMTAYQVDGEWNFVALEEHVALNSSLAYDRSGKLFMSYYDFWSRSLWLTEWTGSYWERPLQLDVTYRSGAYSSLDFDSADRPHISYNNMEVDTLEYIARQQGHWQRNKKLEQAEPDRALHSSLAIGPDDNTYIVYYNLVRSDLRMLVWDGSRWQGPVIIDRDGVGLFPCIEFEMQY